MAELYEQHNTDDVLIRSVIAGVLNLLNNNIHYTQVWDGSTLEDISVPWYYNFAHANNERFLQDNYTFFGKRCFNQRKIDGDFNTYPKGILTYKSCSINQNSCTNIFTTGKYMKNVNGVLTSYAAFLNSIPLDVIFECAVYTSDTDFLTMLKIEQAMRDTFYKNKSFYVTYRGMRIGCTVGFPETAEFGTSMEITHDNTNRENKLTFSLGLETYQPCFDTSNELPADCSMSAIGFNARVTRNNKASIEFISNMNNTTYPSGAPVELEWTMKSDDDLDSVLIKWIDEDTGEEHYIAKGIYGYRESYVWNIPNSISEFKQPLITLDDSDIMFIEKADIKIIPDISTGYITESSFNIINAGRLNSDVTSVDFSLEYEDTSGNIVIDDNYRFKCNNGVISKVVLKDEPVKYKGEMNVKLVTLVIETLGEEKLSSEVKHVKIL